MQVAHSGNVLLGVEAFLWSGIRTTSSCWRSYSCGHDDIVLFKAVQFNSFTVQNLRFSRENIPDVVVCVISTLRAAL